MATLGYQALLAIPGLKALVVDAMERDPLVFNATLEVQLKTLLIEPLNTLFNDASGLTPTSVSVLLIIDGLDECTGPQMQGHIVEIMADALSKPSLPVAPRRISDHALTSSLYLLSSARLPLESSFETDEDIRVYFEHEFQKIRYASTEAVHPILLAR